MLTFIMFESHQLGSVQTRLSGPTVRKYLQNFTVSAGWKTKIMKSERQHVLLFVKQVVVRVELEVWMFLEACTLFKPTGVVTNQDEKVKERPWLVKCNGTAERELQHSDACSVQGTFAAPYFSFSMWACGRAGRRTAKYNLMQTGI